MKNRNRIYIKKIKAILKPPLMLIVIFIGFLLEFLMELPFIIAMGIGKIANSK